MSQLCHLVRDLRACWKGGHCEALSEGFLSGYQWCPHWWGDPHTVGPGKSSRKAPLSQLQAPLLWCSGGSDTLCMGGQHPAQHV